MVGLRSLIGQSGERLGLRPCTGAVDVREACDRDPGWIRIKGWARDAQLGEVPPTVLVLGPEGRVVGVALTGRYRLDVRQAVGRPARRAGLDGFVVAKAPAEGLTLAWARRQ